MYNMDQPTSPVGSPASSRGDSPDPAHMMGGHAHLQQNHAHLHMQGHAPQPGEMMLLHHRVKEEEDSEVDSDEEITVS